MLAKWTPDLDPNNPRHVEAYVCASSESRRVRKERVLAIVSG